MRRNKSEKSFGDSSRGERGQTVIDFALGASVFLLAVGFVFTFIPTLMQPLFSDQTPGTHTASERSASIMVDNLLQDDHQNAGPTNLNESCTVELFNSGVSYPGCPYDGSDLEDSFGLSDRASRVNVTISTLDGGVATITDENGNSAQLARGPVPDSTTEFSSTTRIVYLSGTEHELVVRIW